MFYLGYYGKGVLNITNGGVFEGDTSPHIAYYNGSEAVINVNGQGSRLNMGGTLGHDGKACTTISNGGLLSANSISMSYEKGYSEMLVDNARVDCRSLLVGYKKPAVLNVVNGSTINISEDFEIAQNNDGIVNVSNSRINVGNNLTMSLSGNGALNILTGGEVVVDVDIKVTIFRGRGSIIVDGPGALLSGGRHFKIGVRGSADMRILNGGVVKIARNVPIDNFGFLTIDGEGSTLFAGVLVENEEAKKEAEVQLTNGGKITIVERDHEADRRADLQEEAFFLFGQ